MAFPTNIQMCKKYIQIVIHVCHAVVLSRNAYHNDKLKKICLVISNLYEIWNGEYKRLEGIHSQHAVVYSNLHASECTLLPVANRRKELGICLVENAEV